MKNKEIGTTLKYLITYFVIAFSGIPFFDSYKLARTIFFIFLAVLFIYYNKKIKKELLIIIAIIIPVILFQTLYFGGGKLLTFVTFISLVILIPYFAISLVGPIFLKLYRNILLIISLISIVFWFADNFIPGFHSFIYYVAGLLLPYTTWELQESIIVYTWEDMQVYNLYRNPGPFHEPGAFAVFLILAIISELFISKALITKRNIIFIINLVTTFSSAGYIAIFILIGFSVFKSKNITLVTKYVISAFMLSVLIFLFTQVEFLGEKLSSQYKDQTEASLNNQTMGRFLGARKALIVMSRYPIVGRGLFANAQANNTSEEAAGYGWLKWISRLGLIVGILYMYFLFTSIKNYSIVNLNSKQFSYFAFIAILAVLAGQKHTSSLCYFMLFLAPIVFPIQFYYREYKLD